MALREVLKSRTSSANQKNLTKEMEDRLKKDDEPVAEEKMEVDESASAAATAAEASTSA
jgi:hypothetical protein